MQQAMLIQVDPVVGSVAQLQPHNSPIYYFGHMPPIFLINLEQDEARLESMSAQLRSLRLQFTRVDGVLGSTIPDKSKVYDTKLNRKLYARDLTDGEIGCYCGHLRAIQQLHDSHSQCGLILEDDVILSQELPRVLQEIEFQAQHFDMIKLIGRHDEIVWRPPGWQLSAVQITRYNRVPSFASAYILSKSGAERILDKRTRIFRPIDIDFRYFWEYPIQVFGALPYPVSHPPTPVQSSIGVRRASQPILYHYKRVRDQILYTLKNKTEQRKW